VHFEIPAVAAQKLKKFYGDLPLENRKISWTNRILFSWKVPLDEKTMTLYGLALTVSFSQEGCCDA